MAISSQIFNKATISTFTGLFVLFCGSLSAGGLASPALKLADATQNPLADCESMTRDLINIHEKISPETGLDPSGEALEIVSLTCSQGARSRIVCKADYVLDRWLGEARITFSKSDKGTLKVVSQKFDGNY